MTGLPILCALIALPFLSATVIVLVPRLRSFVGRHPRVTWPIGAAGLTLLLLGLVGVLPHAAAIPLMACGGVVSGFSMFWSAEAEEESEGGDDWRWGDPAPDEPPLRPLDEGPDWALFDLLRGQWELQPSPASDE